jgi:hypothetical protein
MAPRYFFLHFSSSWVKIRLHTKNQLPRLPGSALKVPVVVVVVVGWWLPTHYQVKLQLQLRLSWAVTINKIGNPSRTSNSEHLNNSCPSQVFKADFGESFPACFNVPDNLPLLVELSVWFCA